MLQKDFFKIIEDKHLRTLYQVIYDHLSSIDTLNQKDMIETYRLDLKAFLNGHTKKDKLFKLLRKSLKVPITVYLEWLIKFAEYKIKYIDYPLIHLDDLYTYTINQSKVAFLFLSIGDGFLKPIDLIQELGMIDKMTHILINFETLKQKKALHFPRALLDDYHIEYDLDGQFLLNNRFFAMWDMLAYKVMMSIQKLFEQLHRFRTLDQKLIHSLLTHFKQQLLLYDQTFNRKK